MNLNTNTQKLTALSGNISKLNFAYENWNAITEKYFFFENSNISKLNANFQKSSLVNANILALNYSNVKSNIEKLLRKY